MSKVLENLIAAQKAGVPLIALVTHDQPASVEAITTTVNGGPQIAWDCINGLRALNEEGRVALEGIPPQMLKDSPRPAFGFRAVLALPPRSIVLAYNGHAYLGEPPVVQAIQNLRETLKENKRMLVLMGPNFAEMPPGLQADVITLEEDLPTEAQLTTLINELHESAHRPQPDPKAVPSMVSAVRGLPALFTAEQVISMSFRKHGLDMDALWERKRQAINATKGLSIARSKLHFADLAGMEVLMDFLRRYQGGPKPARCILFWDEIEKMMAGAGGEATDSSGVSSDFLNVCLKKMEDLAWAGIILFGVPGSGKTAICDAAAGEFGLEKVTMDFGAFKGRYVGDSESAVRTGFGVVEALGGEDVLVMATCNRMKSLPPEFRRRFWLGNWFFPVPTLAEQEPMKRIHEKTYGCAGQEWPDTTGWTGAEIRNCARLTHRLNCTLKEAAKFIVPISEADPESLEDLMKLADHRFLAVGTPGKWRKPDENAAPVEVVGGKAKRKIE